MRATGRLARAILGLSILGLSACAPAGSHRADLAPETSAVRSSSDQQTGDENHPKILAEFGGAYANPRLAAYVSGIGQRIASVSEQPNARWTFTVLDTPVINAFAIPGGYVYVTRGLVALAGDEAQLAGVLGHEIGHVTAGHSSLRESRSTVAGLGLLAGALGLAVLGIDSSVASGLLDVGQSAAGGILADYSRGDELDADNLGIRYLARAGYDPYAEAEFLDRLSASAALDAKIAGKGYDPNRVDFFASHPADAPRTRQAIQVAQAAGAVTTVGADRNRDRFLQAIDGMAWGDSAKQGFVDGRTFSHPGLGFTFTVPPGFTISNTSNAVVASGPQSARFIMDGGRDPGGTLTDYIARRWAPALARQVRSGQLGQLSAQRINGLEAANAVLPVQLNNRIYDALLVAYRLNGTVYRVTGLAPRGSGLLSSLGDAAETFRPLSAAERGALREKRIEVVTVRPGDTAERLAARMNVDAYQLDRFRVLNGLAPGQQPRAGDRVKLVR